MATKATLATETSITESLHLNLFLANTNSKPRARGGGRFRKKGMSQAPPSLAMSSFPEQPSAGRSVT